jgi:hypothetical protein
VSLPWLFYILVGREVKCATDVLEWEDWTKRHRRHIAETFIRGYRVSTIFLGIDHNFSGVGPPLLFESMVFGPKMEPCNMPGGVTWLFHESLNYQPRYSTYNEAELGHEELCQEIRRLIADDKSVTAEALRHAKVSKQ